MPATFPSHQAAVLPLKLWRPYTFDGVALVVGSAAPDLVYAADGIAPAIRTHAWHSVLWWSVPVTLLVGWLIRRAAPTVAGHLPTAGRFNLPDYGVLGAHRYRLWVTVACAAVGAASHLCWDAFTHPSIDGGTVLFPALARQTAVGLPLYEVLQLGSSLLGALTVLGLVLHLGSHRLLVRWHGPPPRRDRRPVPFWSAVIVVTSLLCALLPVLPGSRGPHVVEARLAAAVLLGLLAGAATSVAASSAASSASRAGTGQNAAASSASRAGTGQDGTHGGVPDRARHDGRGTGAGGRPVAGADPAGS